jgi:hypothetical protein
MNQDRNIGTVRLSVGFCVCFCFTKTIIMEIFLIYFMTPLNFPPRKLFYVINIRETFGPLSYNFEVAPLGLFVNYPSFLPDLDEA